MRSKDDKQPEKVPVTSLQAGDVFEPSAQMKKYLLSGYRIKPKHVELQRVFTEYDPSRRQAYSHVNIWYPKLRKMQVTAVVTSETDLVVPARAIVKATFEQRRKRQAQEHPLDQLYKDKNALQATVTLGCDPEVFVVSGVTNEVIPAWMYLPSKKEPATWQNDDASGNLYWDGVQAEFTQPPRQCLQETTDRLQGGLTGIWSRANLMVPFLKPKLSSLSVVRLTDEIVAGASKEQIELGCDPSVNVWGLVAQKPDVQELKERFAGGHMHFGLTFHGQCSGPLRIMKTAQRDAVLQRTVRMLDLFSGLVGVSLAACLDNPIRRKFYGLPGEIRLPAHGIEYRTNSNFWLCHPAIAHMFWDISRAGLRLGIGDWEKKLPKLPAKEEVQDAILATDVKQARKLLGSMAGVLNCLYSELYQPNYAHFRMMAKLAVRTVLNGLESAVDDPLNMEKNWLISSGEWLRISQGKNAQWGSAAYVLDQGKKV